MKKQILLLSFCSLLSAGAFSQISKGSKLLGVNLSAAMNSNSNYNSLVNVYTRSSSSNRMYGIGPTAGYFIADNFALGLSVGYKHSISTNEYKNPSIDDYTYFESTIDNSISVTPYARYYFNQGKKLTVFAQLNIGYAVDFGQGQDIVSQCGGTYSRTDYITEGSTFNTFLTPGLNYFLTEKCALETTIGSVGYLKSKHSINSELPSDGNSQSLSYSNLGFNLSVSTVNIGFRYFIR